MTTQNSTVELSGDQFIDFPQSENPARKAFREAVAEIAERAKVALPDANGRIDAAVKIVLQGDVELLDDGNKAKVASQSNGTTTYHLVNGTCDCKDFPKAPQGFCKHRLGSAIYKRATTLAKQRLEAQLGGTHNGQQASVQPAEAPKAELPIPPQFVVELHGKQFVTLQCRSDYLWTQPPVRGPATQPGRSHSDQTTERGGRSSRHQSAGSCDAGL